MEVERPKDKKMAKPANKTSEFTGEKIIAYLMKTLGFKRRQTLAELLDVEDRTLSNWKNESYENLIKQSARLRVVYDAVYAFEGAGIPQSAYLKLLNGELLGTERSLIQAINADPNNELIPTVIRMFSEKYFVDIPKSHIDKTLKEGKLSEDDRERIRTKHRGR